MPPLDPAAGLPANLARNLKYVRQQRALTQEALGFLAGVPRSTISHLETGAANPTLSVLVTVAAALKLPLEELISTPHARLAVFRAGSLPTSHRGPGGRASVTRLLPDPVPGVDFERLEIPPGSRIPGVPHRPGTREYLVCERGRITLSAGGESIDLEAGDVVAFQGDQAHSYQAAGSRTAVGFSVVTLAPLAGALARDDDREPARRLSRPGAR